MARSHNSRTKDKARLWVLVFDRSGQPVKATVEWRSEKEGAYAPIDYDNRFQRYVSEGMEPGQIDLRIRGPEGTRQEQRSVDLKAGENHVSVMVAEEGLPAIQTPDGPWYFEPRPELLLLHVTGQQALQTSARLLGESALAYRVIERAPVSTSDDVLLEIEIGTDDQGHQRRNHIENMLVPALQNSGLRAQTRLPAYVSGEVQFGITGEIIVQFVSSATPTEIKALVSQLGIEQVRPIEWMVNAFLFRDPDGPSLRLLERVEAISRNNLVVFAEPNVATRVQTFQYTPADYVFPETPHLTLIGADSAWEAIETMTPVPRGGSPDIVIGVLDPYGVDPAHPELTGPVSDGSPKQVANFDFVNMTAQTVANVSSEHGTQCAGSATGNMDNTRGNGGVAPNCRLIGGRLPSLPTMLDVADIWVWMAGFLASSAIPGFPAPLPQGADVISNSWGMAVPAPAVAVMNEVFDFLTTYPRNGRGAVMVFAAGNYGFHLVDPLNRFAADPRTLSIGASINSNPTVLVSSKDPDHAGNTVNLPAVVDTRSYFSPYGMTIDLVAPSNTSFGTAFDLLRFADFVDPIMAPVRSGRTVTSLTTAVVPGPAATAVDVASVAGFQAGSLVMIGTLQDPATELRSVQTVGANMLTLRPPPLDHPHGIGTLVSNSGADWPSQAVTSTSLTSSVLSTDTVLPVSSVAGFTAGDLVAVGTPGGANTETTTVIAVGGSNLTVTAIRKNHPSGTSVATGPGDFAKNSFLGFGGTSHACPTVAGAAALMLSVRPDLNWLEVRALLQDTATPIDTLQASPTGQWADLDGDALPDFSQWYGHGRLNVHQAVVQTIALANRTDAVVRDNLADTGVVPSTGWPAESPDIWVRSTNDPIPVLGYLAAPPHENPISGQDNWIYMRVRNDGTATARQIFLRALITHFPGIEFVYPDDWQPKPRLGVAPALPLTPGTYLIGQVEVNDLAAGTDTIVKLLWPQDLVPPETVLIGAAMIHWHPCLLLEASPHDGPATVSGLAFPVQGDNNIAQRNIAIAYPLKAMLMSGVVVGSRAKAGVDGLIIDRTAIPPHYHVVLRTPDQGLMRLWIDLARSGRRLATVPALGTPPQRRRQRDPYEQPPDQQIRITLLDKARVAVEDGHGNVMTIDAAAQTRFTMTSVQAPTALTDTNDIGLGTYQGETVLHIDHSSGAVVLPMRLAANEWAPVFVGIDPPNDTMQPLGLIRISQVRGDGGVSSGYQILV